MYSFDFWWRLLRPHTLTASIVPVAVGSAYAFHETHTIHIPLFLAMLIASMLIQGATNLFNEYFDYVRGLDTAQSVGISGTIVHDGASPRFVLSCAIICYTIAGILGIWICFCSSWWLIAIGGFCMLIGFLYTGGPHPISAGPLGELFAGGFLGTGVICISFFIQTGYVSLRCVLISLPILVLIGLILTANNLRDRVGDTANGRRTLVILLGHVRSVLFMKIAFLVCYLWPLVLIINGVVAPWVLLCWLSVQTPLRAIKIFTPENQMPKQMMPAMLATAQTNTRYGLLYALGILLATFFPVSFPW